jgi:hypothetical protein
VALLASRPARTLLAQPTWRVSSSPTHTIGSDAADETIFSRAVSARLHTGHLIVVDGSVNEVRVFDANGAFVARRSRRGRGPGEFDARNFAVSTSADSVFVLEQPPGTAQVHVFTLNGGTSRFALHGAPGAPASLNPMLRTPSGHVLAAVGGFRVVAPLAAGQSRVDSLPLRVYSTGVAQRWVSIGSVPSLEMFGYAAANGEPGVMGSAFGSLLVTGVSGNSLWIGNARTGAIRVVNVNGAPERTVRLSNAPAALTPRIVETRRAAALENATSDAARERVRAMYARGNLPSTLPHFTRFTGGPNGEMWVELAVASEKDETHLLVVDSRGATKARVIVPRRLRLDQVGPDWILGVAKDELGREYVLQYALTRSAR